MCVNSWSVEHDERNRKAQKYCFMGVRAPSPTPSYSILCHMPVSPGPCLSSFPDGLLRNASSFLELFSALAQLPYCNMKNP